VPNYLNTSKGLRGRGRAHRIYREREHLGVPDHPPVFVGPDLAEGQFTRFARALGLHRRRATGLAPVALPTNRLAILAFQRAINGHTPDPGNTLATPCGFGALKRRLAMGLSV
jgi:hypothetical protein